MVTFLAVGLISLPRLFSTKRLKLQLLRSCLLMASTVLNFLALRHLRLDQTMTIQFLAPLLVALAAGPMLGEWVGWRRLIAILVGFVGILVAIRPGFAEVPPGVIFAFGCMLTYAIFMLLTRYLSAYDPSEVTLAYSMVAGVVLAAPVAIAGWVWPANSFIWVLVLSMGLWGALGHLLFIMAYRHAPASTIAPFIYTQILAMTVLGYSVFGDLPDQWTLLGSSIVIASGIYLVHREHVTRGAKPAPPPVV
jgi:drug/metabolite transporter (DMT)-like permease